LRWRHQLCYNSPSTSSFNLTENLFFRDVETPTDEWAAQQTVPENLVVTMLCTLQIWCSWYLYII
jgi:hypothetical protein